jgi:hypothetical protein
MAIGSTEEWLTGAIGRSDMVSGFIPRFLLVPYPGKESVFNYPPDRDRNWEDRLILSLKAARRVKYRYKVLSEARATYQEWYDHTAKAAAFEHAPMLRPYFHRMTVYAWKICMVEAVSQRMTKPMGMADAWNLEGVPMSLEVTIDKAMMLLATSFLTLTLAPLAAMFEDSMVRGRFQEQQRDVIEILKAVKPKHGFISRSDLLRAVKQSTQDLDKVTQALIESGRLLSAQHLTGKRGRIPLMYRLLRHGEDLEERQAAAVKFWDKRAK